MPIKKDSAPSTVRRLIRTSSDLGSTMRSFRKSRHITLKKVSDLSHLGMRFLSELERGKESAELGKVLQALHNLGLEVIIQSRGYTKKSNSNDSVSE